MDWPFPSMELGRFLNWEKMPNFMVAVFWSFLDLGENSQIQMVRVIDWATNYRVWVSIGPKDPIKAIKSTIFEFRDYKN